MPFWFSFSSHWPGPRSLATTNGVSVDFLSSGYLDVSVPRVRSYNPMYSGNKYLSQPAVSHPRTASESDYNELSGGFPHSEIHGSKPIPGSPWLNAGYHVLHRLLLPRHPPNALFALDLIQKKLGFFWRQMLSTTQSQPGSCCDRFWLVYLTWTTLL